MIGGSESTEYQRIFFGNLFPFFGEPLTFYGNPDTMELQTIFPAKRISRKRLVDGKKAVLLHPQ